MKKIHITQKQLEECVKLMNEEGRDLNLNSGNFEQGTSPLQQATIAKQIDNTVGGVTLNGQKISQSTNPSDFANNMKTQAQNVLNGNMNEGVTFTKKQIKEARLNNLVKNSVPYTKRQIRENAR